MLWNGQATFVVCSRTDAQKFVQIGSQRAAVNVEADLGADGEMNWILSPRHGLRRQRAGISERIG